jgi:hypothetical protein
MKYIRKTETSEKKHERKKREKIRRKTKDEHLHAMYSSDITVTQANMMKMQITTETIRYV